MSENAAKSAYFGTAPSLLVASQGVIIPKWFAHNGTNTIWPRTSKELWHRDCLFVVVRRILAPPKFSHQTSLKCIKSVKHHSSRLLKWAWRLHRNRTQRSPGGDAFWGVGLQDEPLPNSANCCSKTRCLPWNSKGNDRAWVRGGNLSLIKTLGSNIRPDGLLIVRIKNKIKKSLFLSPSPLLKGRWAVFQLFL